MSVKEKFVSGVSGVPKYSVLSHYPKQNRTALVIPVINEGSKVISQLYEINTLNFNVDIIIADGGSTDESLEYFRSGEGSINTLLTKHGKGKLSAQLRMAFHYCLQKRYEFIITMDGNNKDGALGIENIGNALKQGFDFVQGSRYVPGGHSENTPILREIGIKWIHAPLISLSARHRFTDTTNGFRGFSRRLIQSSEMSIFREVFDGYELLNYLPIRSARLGFKICEVPVVRRYPNGKPPTKIVGFRSHLDILIVLITAAVGRYNPKVEKSKGRRL
jgi:dolichol-phosphate mannosyltransferase